MGGENKAGRRKEESLRRRGERSWTRISRVKKEKQRESDVEERKQLEEKWREEWEQKIQLQEYWEKLMRKLAEGCKYRIRRKKKWNKDMKARKERHCPTKIFCRGI